MLDPICDFVVETIARRDDGDFCVGIEEVQDAPGCYLEALEVNVNVLGIDG